MESQIRALATASGIESDVIQRMLERASGVGDSEDNVGRRLIINRLKVEGQLTFDHTFQTGINLILSEKNFAGKTTILDIIRYCFSTKKTDIDSEVRDKLQRIMLEFSLDGTTFTILRTENSQDNGIYGLTLDRILSGSRENPAELRVGRFKSFFLQEFGFPELKSASTPSGEIAKRAVSVGFGDYLRAFYQDQDRGYSELFSRESFSTRQHVFNVLIGARNAKVSNHARIFATMLDNEHAILRERSRALDEYLESRMGHLVGQGKPGASLRSIQSKADDLKRKIEQADAEIRVADGPNDVAAIDELVQKISSFSSRRAELTREKDALADRLASLELATVNAESNAVAAARFQSYHPSLCPHCEQSIPLDRVKGESDEGICRVCTRPGVPDETAATRRKEFLAELSDAREEVIARLATISDAIDETKTQLELWEPRLSALSGPSPAHALMALRHDSVTSLRTQLAEQVSAHAEISAHVGYIETFRHQLSQLAAESSAWKAIEGAAQDEEKTSSGSNPYDAFEFYVAEMLKRLTKAHRGRPSLDPKGILKIGSTPFTELRAGEKARVCIAVYYAMLRMSIEEDGRLPKFLIIDSPKQQEMDPEDFHEIGQAYKELAEAHGNEFQLILASADPEIAFAAPEKNILRIPAGEKSLKNADVA